MDYHPYREGIPIDHTLRQLQLRWFKSFILSHIWHSTFRCYMWLLGRFCSLPFSKAIEGSVQAVFCGVFLFAVFLSRTEWQNWLGGNSCSIATDFLKIFIYFFTGFLMLWDLHVGLLFSSLFRLVLVWVALLRLSRGSLVTVCLLPSDSSFCLLQPLLLTPSHRCLLALTWVLIGLPHVFLCCLASASALKYLEAFGIVPRSNKGELNMIWMWGRDVGAWYWNTCKSFLDKNKEKEFHK